MNQSLNVSLMNFNRNKLLLYNVCWQRERGGSTTTTMSFLFSRRKLIFDPSPFFSLSPSVFGLIPLFCSEKSYILKLAYIPVPRTAYSDYYVVNTTKFYGSKMIFWLSIACLFFLWRANLWFLSLKCAILANSFVSKKPLKSSIDL